MSDLFQNLQYNLGVLGFILIVLLVAFFFIPAIISIIKHTRYRVFICVGNIVVILLLFTKSFLPLVGWLVIALAAIIDKRDYT